MTDSACLAPRKAWPVLLVIVMSVRCALADPPAGTPRPAPSARITLVESASVPRAGELAQFGLPVPRQWNLADPAKLRLVDGSGRGVPAQFDVLARWAAPPDKATAPVKWVLVSTPCTLAAGATSTITAEASAAGPQPDRPLKVETTQPGKIVVDTGPARFELNLGQSFNLIEQVTVDGRAMLQPLPPAQAIEYSPIDKLSIVEGGKPNDKPRPTQVVVELAGPLHAVVRATGSIPDTAGRPVLDFTARLHFAAGRPEVVVEFTVENNHPIIAGEDGQPTNAHRQGAVNSVYIGDLRLKYRLAPASRGGLLVLTHPDVSARSPAGPVRLYQDSTGLDTWNAYVGQVGWPDAKALAHPRLQSCCTRKGYEVTAPGLATPRSGDQAVGWMTVGRDGPDGQCLTAAVADFWQNFPKALQADPDGTLAVSLFPNGQRFRHNLRVGEEKTHRVLLRFGGRPDGQAAAALAQAFNRPLRAVVAPEWYADSGVLVEVPPADLKRWPLYERYVRIAFEPNPDFDPAKHDPNFGNRTLAQVVRHYNFFGWQDYGDVPLDYEAFGDNQAGQMNLKYWFVHGMFLQYCRSGEPRWLDLALPAAWHLADIDILHVPDAGPQHWAHGAYFGHSQHDEPGNENPNRNFNSPSVDLFFGVPDLMLAYHLTGNRRFRDVALECLASMQAMSEFTDPASPVLQRGQANLIFGYIEGYRATGDKRWLDELRKFVARVADLTAKPWLTDPDAFGKKNPETFQSMFQFAQAVWALGRYLDFCGEYGIEDDLKVAAAIGAYADWLVKVPRKEFVPGRATTPNEFYFAPTEAQTYLEINNWTLVMADVLAYAFKYTGQKRFLDEAAKFYATGTIDPTWRDDPPVYLATKDLANSCNWGLVYMNQSRSQDKP